MHSASQYYLVLVSTVSRELRPLSGLAPPRRCRCFAYPEAGMRRAGEPSWRLIVDSTQVQG